ncbi:MAG: hypothetical protein ACTSQI_21970, partial [Candidatus Helarchaeota archaeon]
MIEASSQDFVVSRIKNLLDSLNLPEKVKDIPNLPIYDLRDLSSEDAKVLTKYLHVKTIKDFAKLPYASILEKMAVIVDSGIPKDKLEKLISAAKYILKAVEFKP